jgi:hypothetical protein
VIGVRGTRSASTPGTPTPITPAHETHRWAKPARLRVEEPGSPTIAAERSGL